ncbi:MAG TPA: hypothetical protein VGG75_05390 [Trebonia sp.]
MNTGKNQVSVIFGGGTGSSQVTVNGLSGLSGSGNRQAAHVVLQDVQSDGRTTAVAGPGTIFNGTLPVTDGSVRRPACGVTLARRPVRW